MKIAILDTNYAKAEHIGMAGQWLHWEAARNGLTITDVNAADVVLATISSQQAVSHLRTVVRGVRKENRRAPVLLGGGACYAPAIFDGVVDACCVGEGVNFIQTLARDGLNAVLDLPETWIPGDARRVIPSTTFPWDVPPIMNTDGFVRVFGSRGCRGKCLFCQTGWEETYRVNPDMPKLQRQILQLKKQGQAVSIVTNDGADDAMIFPDGQEFVSAKMTGLKKLMPITRQRTKSVRIGVEGVSERLRRALGKPVGNDDLLTVTADCLSNGVGVRWFFIPGLPGETESDWLELRDLVTAVKRNIPKGAVMCNFHSYIPMPATPMGILPLVDNYYEPFEEFRTWFFHRDGFTRRVQIIAPNKYPSRLKRATESMAATEPELRRGWFSADNPNWRVQYTATPKQLRKCAVIYARRVGLDYTPATLPSNAPPDAPRNSA